MAEEIIDLVNEYRKVDINHKFEETEDAVKITVYFQDHKLRWREAECSIPKSSIKKVGS